MVEFEPLDRSSKDIGENGFQPLGGHLRLDRRVVTGVEDEQTDVGPVALVAGAGMGDIAERDPPAHVSMIRSPGSTRSLSTNTL